LLLLLLCFHVYDVVAKYLKLTRQHKKIKLLLIIFIIMAKLKQNVLECRNTQSVRGEKAAGWEMM
jgi:hypothetical protein